MGVGAVEIRIKTLAQALRRATDPDALESLKRLVPQVQA